MHVRVRYNCKHYRIDDIDFESNPMSTFVDSQDREITFYDYYRRQYGIEIGNLKQPTLISRQKRMNKLDGLLRMKLVDG